MSVVAGSGVATPIGTAAIQNEAITPAKLGTGTMALVATSTLEADATEIQFTGLDIDTDLVYKIFINLTNADSATRTYALEYNDDSTVTNYFQQILQASATVVSGARVNDSDITAILSNQNCVIEGTIYRDVDGFIRGLFQSNREAAVGVVTDIKSLSTTGSGANLTSLEFRALTADAIGTGTTVSLYKVTA